MKVKLFHLVYIALFLAACLLPFVGMAALGPSEAGSNEILASKPSLLNKDGSFNWEVLDDTEEYIADRFALRQEFVSLWAWLNAELLHTSVEDQVILGENDWLYYASTADDYMGVTMDDATLTYAARNLYLMQEYTQSTGARFLFTVAPNKNSLYPEHMPDHYPAGDTSNAQLLAEKLAAQNVSCADLFTVFRQEEEVLYYATDSHWTGRGAALAADTVLQQLRKSSGYFDGSFVSKTPHTGDLYEMLYPAGLVTETDSTYEKGFTFTYTNEPNGGNAITIKTEQPTGRDSLLCWRDSFGVALHPYLAESYETALFSRASTYDLTLIGQQKADAVLIELVERNLHQLVEYAPILPAPRRCITVEGYGAETLSASVGKTTDTLTQLTVTVPRTLVDRGSGLYVKVNDTIYEGCVICTDDGLICSVYVSEEIPKVVELITLTHGVYTTYSSVVEF